MNKVDWSLAPKWADHVVIGPLSGIRYWANEERRIQFGGEFDCRDNNHVNEGWSVVESKLEQWSGPQDGLPPINTECEALDRMIDTWVKVKIVDHQGTVDTAACRVARTDRLFWAQDFRAIKTTEQLAAEQRETSIREFMDIVGIDCRVTASKAVDAGFKREVV